MATDFFQRQDDARRKTALLVAYFALCVLLIAAGIYCVVLGIFFYGSGGGQAPSHPGAEQPAFSWWNPHVAVWVALGTLGIIAIGSLYKTLTLGHGGEVVARMLGGRPVSPETTDPGERRLLNVVEEMAIASGTPVPPVFVLDDETAVNAFAAGLTPGNAVIGVTRGTVQLLDRDELQGVVAHEFSHILNGDMRLNVRLMGILHGILLIALIGYMIVRGAAVRSYHLGSRRSRNSGGGLIVLGIALIAIGYIGVFFGRLIKSAVSRQREFLADASAVQFTRNPSGLAGALKKIGGLVRGSRIENSNAEEASHLFFGNAVRSWFNLLSTHPPLEIRIKHLDPDFDGRFPPVEPPREAAAEPEEPEPQRAATGTRAGFPFGLPGTAGQRSPLEPLEAVLQVGAPGADHLAYASALIEALPDPLHSAANSPFGARAVVYALLLDRDESAREEQLQHLAEQADSAVFEETRRLSGIVDQLAPESRLPLIDLTFPALRNLSERQYRAFRDNVERLVKADRKIELFEFVLQRMLMRHLDDYFEDRKPPVVQYHALRPMLPHVGVLLSTLAHVGHKDTEEARRALTQGASMLQTKGQQLQLLPKEQCGLQQIDGALVKLVQASPAIKKQVIAGCAACIATDGEVTVTECELLRAVADSLDAPMPPLLAGQRIAQTEPEHPA